MSRPGAGGSPRKGSVGPDAASPGLQRVLRRCPGFPGATVAAAAAVGVLRCGGGDRCVVGGVSSPSLLNSEACRWGDVVFVQTVLVVVAGYFVVAYIFLSRLY